MSDKGADGDEDDKSFFGWARDWVFVSSSVGISAVVAILVGVIGLERGDAVLSVIKDSLFALAGSVVLIACFVIVLSCLRWFVRQRFVVAFFTAVAAMIEVIIKGVGALLGLALVLAVLAGIAGLLLFGIRQLF